MGRTPGAPDAPEPPDTRIDGGDIEKLELVDYNAAQVYLYKFKDSTARAAIPTTTSQLINNSGFITSAQAPVQSVNGQTGAVVLGASDVGALPSNTTYVSSVNGQSGAVTVNDEVFVAEYGVTTFAEVEAAYNSGKTVLGRYGSSYYLLNIFDATQGCRFDACDQYAVDLRRITLKKTNNVWSNSFIKLVSTGRTINGHPLTSNIILTASDVGALPSSTAIPVKTSDLTNDSGFIDSTEAETIATTIATNAAATAIGDYANGSANVAIISTWGEGNAALVTVEGDPIGFQDFYTEYSQNGKILVAWMIGEVSFIMFDVTAASAAVGTVQLSSIVDETLYVVHLTDSGNGLVGTYSSSSVHISTNVSDLINDSGYLTLSTLPIWDGSVT